MIELARISIEHDLSLFSRWLDARNVPHRIAEEEGAQVIWILQPELKDEVNLYLHRYIVDSEFRCRIEADLKARPKQRTVIETLYPRALPHQAPLIYLFIGLSVLVALMTNLGEGGKVLRALLIVNPFELDFRIRNFSERVEGLVAMLSMGHSWRVFSPMFLHFSLMHIVFNMLMLWTLGGQLEIKRGSFAFLTMAMFVGLVSNIAQYFDSGYLFGGMSGVVYGLVGYCWMWRRVDPDIFLPDVLFKFSIAWLLLGYTPITEWLGWGRMANSAHLYGLIAGLFWGWVTTMGAKRSTSS